MTRYFKHTGGTYADPELQADFEYNNFKIIEVSRLAIVYRELYTVANCWQFKEEISNAPHLAAELLEKGIYEDKRYTEISKQTYEKYDDRFDMARLRLVNGGKMNFDKQ